MDKFILNTRFSIIKMKKLLYIFSLLLLFSCKKEKLPELPNSNSPIFTIEGTIDGQTISVNAGQDNYFMHSEEFEFHNVTQRKGRLSNEENTFEITLSDGIVDVPNSTFDLSSVSHLAITEMPSTPLLYLDKSDLANGEFIEHITWMVDGEIYTSQGPLVIYEPGIYDICADVTFIDQSEATSCSEVILGYDKNAKGALKFILGQNNTLLAFFDTPEYEIDHVDWYINDSLISTDKVNLSVPMTMNECNLKGIVYYSNGVIRTRTAYINKLNTEYYIQDLTAFENQSSISWDFKLHLDILLNGQHYQGVESTTNSTQLQVISVQEYGHNVNGDKVLLVKGILNAPLFHLESESLVNASLTLSFALPYK